MKGDKKRHHWTMDLHSFLTHKSTNVIVDKERITRTTLLTAEQNSGHDQSIK
jgi:hypothetical protein